MLRVLVTRPEPDTSCTAKKLARMGFEPVLLPLTKIVPLHPEDWPASENFHAMAITSANAVRHAPPGLLAKFAHLPVFAVGERTGKAARDGGLRVADSEAGDAEKLAKRIAAAVPPRSNLLLLCGRVRRQTLGQELARAEITMQAVETYDTVAIPPSEREFTAALDNAPVDAVLFYSAVAAQIFAGLVEGPLPSPLVGNAVYLTISERVAKMLPEAARERTRIAREPTEEAMLSLLAG